MGKAKKALEIFISAIPAAKLTEFPTSKKNIWSDDGFRLDMQGVCSNRLPQGVHSVFL